MALATDGADLAFDAFKAAGLNPDAPLFFDRAVEVAGKTEHAQFRTVRIPKTNMPVVGFFVCEHMTPQFVYRAEWAKHPNGARGIAGVTVIAEQPAKWIRELEKYFGAGFGEARGRRARGRYRHAADPLPDAQGLRRCAIPASRRCGRATIRRCSASGSTASPPARRC